MYFGNDFNHPDKIITEKGKGLYAYYDEIVDSDDILSGLMESRISSITCLDWIIEPVSEDESDIEVSDFIKGIFHDNDKFPVWCSNILGDGQRVGYSVQLINWKLSKEKKFIPDDLIAQIPDRFRFDPLTRELRILTLDNPSEGTPPAPYRWLVFSFHPRYSNPYGVSLLRSVFWDWYFKHYAVKWWVQAAERGAVVSPWGYYPKGTPVEEQVKMALALKNFLGNKYGLSEEGTKVEFPHITLDPEFSSRLVDTLNASMRYRIEGSELASGTAESGSRALGETHQERYQTRIETDAKALMTVINVLIRWIVEINYGDIVPPRFKIKYEQEKDTTPARLNLETAAKLGIPVTVEDAADLLQLPLAPEGETALIKNPTPANPFGIGSPTDEPTDETDNEPSDEDISEEPDSGKQRAHTHGDKLSFKALMKNINQSHIISLEDAVAEGGFDSYMSIRKQILDDIQGQDTVAAAFNSLLYFQPDMTKLSDYLHTAYLWCFLHGYHDLFDNPRIKAIRKKQRRKSAHGWYKLMLETFKDTSEPGWIPVKPEEAIKIYIKKKALTRKQFDKLDAYTKRNAITAAGLTKKAIQNGLTKSLLDALEKGTTLQDFKKSLLAEDIVLTKAHAETIFRTNVQTSYNDGHLQAMFDPDLKDAIPGFEFVAIMDDRTTPMCEERDSKVYSREQVETAGIAPPLHYNCRSTIIPVFEDEEPVFSENPIEPAMDGFGLWYPLDL